MATNIDKFLEPSEISGGIPLGGIIFWQNPNPAAPNPSPPSGFEFCDGTTVTTAGPMFGAVKANLMVTSGGGTKGIARGADVTVNYGTGTALVAGGADTHLHGGGTDSQGNHDHNVSSHNHTISSDGSHQHTLLGPTSGKITFNPATPAGPDTLTNSAGAHTHTGSTGSTGGSTNFNGGHSHNVTTSSSSSLPRFVELAYIIRVVA
jgi:hypothetical protein